MLYIREHFNTNKIYIVGNNLVKYIIVMFDVLKRA